MAAKKGPRRSGARARTATKRTATKRTATKRTATKRTATKRTATKRTAATRAQVRRKQVAARQRRRDDRALTIVTRPALDADDGSDRARRLYEIAQRSRAVAVDEARDREIDEAPAQPATDATPPPSPILRPSGDVVIDVKDLRVFYGAVAALKGISFEVRQGEVVSIIGSNGAGKTTTMKTVSGVSEMLKHVRGHVTILGERVESLPAHRIARLGVAHVPEGRKVFPNQTVRDNLMLGAFQRKDSNVEKDIDEQYERFPILGKRRHQPAGLMSGGEQQMLAIARGLMARPKVMLFDEPSMGLAPLIVKQVFDILDELKREGMTILLVEQMAFQALGIADRAYVLETGEITLEGTGRELLSDPKIKEAYLGA